ncbi:nucleotide kinase-like protein [Thermogladius calderae 1633]|uniref:Putative adenylate kinase n=1 Tax=Thermogladius calderae (strain DSM 22663 / VKM B-2946 / 1633) TaxID=1184251 RepID=I3TDU8_THEC1|nr:adenylate kinase family protein [Thermogladius calderae]AFK50936.1 nucleotide kinase-like protein [Thermogladius calderae 1633]
MPGFKCLVVAGTPGVGKSTVSRLLAERIGGTHVDLSELVVREGLYDYYDPETNSYVISEERVSARVRELCESSSGTVISTHYPEVLDSKVVDLVVVLRLDPRVLITRLRKRGWNDKKVAENVMAEVLSVVLTNVVARFGTGKVVEVDVTGKTPEEVVDELLRKVREGAAPAGYVDWLSVVDPSFIEELERVLEREPEA